MLSSIDLKLQNYNEQKGRQFYRQLIERLDNLPGAQSASLAYVTPLGRTRMAEGIVVDGQSAPASEGPIEVNANVIAPAYFQTMGIPLLNGRDFSTADGETSLKVAIVNEAMVHRFWPDRNPLGQRFRLRNQNGPLVEIIGIAKDTKYRTLQEEPRPSFYLPLLQHYQPRMIVHARSLDSPSNLAGPIRNAVQSLDSDVAVFDVKTLSEQLAVSLSQAQMAASFFSIFGLIALVLATFGVYGVMSFYVAQRTRDIGIRMALGARRTDVLKSVITQSLTLVLTGITIGLAASLASTRVISGLLFNISPTDPLAYSAIGLLLAVVGLTASSLPALRASKVDPMIVLRHE
jgi:predicted permease